MVTITQVNQIINAVSVVDHTAEGAESAAHNLDLVQDRGDAVTQSLEKMGVAGGEAAQAVARSTGTAAEALEGVAARGVRSLSDFKKSVRDLRAEEKSLQEELNRANASGTDASDITARLDKTQAELKKTETAYRDLVRAQKLAADTQAAQDGTFNAANVALTGVRDSLISTGQAGTQTFGVLRAGVDGSAQHFQRLTASIDQVSRKMRDVAREESKLEALHATTLAGVNAGTIAPADAGYAIQAQSARLAAAQDELAVARELRDIEAKRAQDEGRETDILRQNTAVERSFLQVAAAAGDEVARTTLELRNHQAALEKMQAHGAVLVSNGTWTQAQVDASIAPQQAKVDTSQKEADAAKRVRDALDMQAAGHTKNAAAAKLEQYQLNILMEEAHKFADMVLAGGNPLKAAFYEVPNAVGVMGGFGKATQIVTGLLTGPGGLVAAAGAVGVAFAGMGIAAEHEQSRIAKLTTQLRATRDDAQAMAASIDSATDALKSRPGWSEDSARQATTAIGSTYNFAGGSSDLTYLANIARDAGEVFGGLENGIKAVQTALTDPTAEIQALYKEHLPGVDKALVDQVHHLQASGQYGEAFALVLDHIKEAVDGAHKKSLTPFGQALEDFKTAGAPAVKILSDFAKAIGEVALQASTWLLNKANSFGSHLADPNAPAETGVGLGGRVLLDNYKAGVHHFGIGQIDPRYAGKNDITTPEGNVAAMVDLYLESKRLGGGTTDGALAHYSGNTPGSLAAQNYASIVYQADRSKLPQDTYKLIQAEEDKRPNLSHTDRMVLFGIAMHESGGHQFRDWQGAPARQVQDPAAAHVVADVDNQKSIAGNAMGSGGGFSSSSLTEHRQEIQDYIASETKLLETQQQGSLAWNETREKITAARVELANTISPQEKITQGLQDALGPLKAQSGYWRSMSEVVSQFNETSRGTGTDQQALTQALAAKQRQLAAAYDDGTDAAERQVKSQQAIADAAGGSAVALQHATNYQQAYTEAQNDFDETSPGFAEAVEKRTTALDRLTAAQMRGQQLQQNTGIENNLKLIQAETDMLGQNVDQRNVSLAVMRAELEMHQKYGDVLPKEAQDYIDLTQKMTIMSGALQQQKSAMAEFTSDIDNMVDSLANGFTQAFLNASNGAISFKSALHGVESQIVSMGVKYAFINPIENAFDGNNRNTLWNIGGLLGGGGSGDDFEGGDPFAGVGTSAASFQAGVGVSGGGSGGGGGIVSGLAGTASSLGGLAGLGAHLPSWLSSGLGTHLFGTATIGGALGGIGGGFALGSMLGKIGGGSGGTIGAGAGSLIGAGIGSIIPGVGTIIGGVLGGAAGGLLGGLFSKTHYAYDQVSGVNGSLAISGTRTKHSDDDVTAGLQQQLNALNASFATMGISVAAGNYGEVGHYHKGKKRSETTFESLLGGINLHTDNHTFDQALHSEAMPKKFDSVDSYQTAIKQLKAMANTIDDLSATVSKFNADGTVVVSGFVKQTGDLRHALDHVLDGKTLSVSDLQTQVGQITTFVGDTMPGLLRATISGQLSWVDQMADLKKQYDEAAKTASSYDLNGASLTDRYQQLYDGRYANNVLAFRQADAGVQARYLTAQGNDQGAALLTFDTSADQQRRALQENWRGFLGDAYASQADYIAQSADLEKTLAAERLQIQASYNGTSIAQLKQYRETAQQSVVSVFGSLTEYARGLNTSEASPLSLQSQYNAANDNLHRDYDAARTGDFEALSRFQGDSQQFLSLSQNWQGSGVGYATDFSAIQDMLKTLGRTDPEKLTATLVEKLSKQQVDATKMVLDQMTAFTTVVEDIQKQMKLSAITNANRPRAA